MVSALNFITWQFDNGVGYLTLNRPPLNILHIPMIQEMEEVLTAAASEQSLQLLIIQAEGKLFSAGVDIADHTAERVGEMIPLFNGVCHALANFPTPTLAAVQGHALGGGCELVICCDMVAAAAHAKLGQPEIKLATFAPIASLRLPAQVGYAWAAELLLRGETITALEAAQIGMVNRVVPAEELAGVVDEYVVSFRGLSAAALRLNKKALRLGSDQWTNLSAVNHLYLDELMATDDVHEGLDAYTNKRAPAWKHQ